MATFQTNSLYNPSSLYGYANTYTDPYQQQLAYEQQLAHQQQLANQQPAYQQPTATAQQVWVPPPQETSDPKVKNLQILDNVLQSDRPTKKKFRDYLRRICKTRGIRLPGSF